MKGNQSESQSTSSGIEETTTRRKAIVAGGATAIASLAGCSGLFGSNQSNGPGDFDAPSKPWTTEELATAAQESGQTSINLYTSAGEAETWNKWESVIQEKYPWFEFDTLVTGRGEQVNQRVVQEYQAGQVTADVCGQVVSSLDDEELRNEIFKRDYEGEYATAKEYPDAYANVFISAYNRGPSLSLPYNTNMVEEQGLDLPNSYNDFLDDPQYEGMDMLIVQDPNMKRFGWIVNYHAEQKGMEPAEWLRELKDTLNFRIGSGHTQVARYLGAGNVAPMMLYSYPWTVLKNETSGLPITNHYVDNIPYFLSSGTLSEVSGAPNPWGARFLMSVSLEPFVQKALATEIPTFTPERQDIDYSGLDMSEDIQNRVSLFGNMDNINFKEQQETRDIGKNAFTEVFGTPEVEVD